MTTAAASATSATSVAVVRSFVSARRRRPWFDWYFMAFAVVLAVILLSDLLAQPFSRLTGSGGSASEQAVAGAALVIGAAAGLLLLAQAFGPLALSPADASWLLLSPLDRRGVLRRPTATAAAVSAVAGGALGVLALAMAGPYLRPDTGAGVHRVPWSWLVLAAVSGAGFFAAAVLAGVLAQPYGHWRSRLRTVAAVVVVAVMLGAVTGERWTAVPRAVTGRLAVLSAGTLGVLAAVAVGAACAVALLVWRMLPSFPAGVVRADSARAGRTMMAAAFLNVPLLTWIAEDSHWRGRLLRSRPWPRLPAGPGRLSPAFALAWVDWRRLARRPAVLTALAFSALAPALACAAATGHARAWVTAAVLLAGAIAAGTQGTGATRRDTNDPALRRLLGVDARAALAARAVLPSLLCAAWLTLALALLVLVGELPGGPLPAWLWPLLGPVAGPGMAAAALRIARTAPINPAERGPETPMGPTPPWLITRAGSVVVGLVGAFPTLRAVLAGHLHGSTFAAQLVFAAAVLGGYLWLAASSDQAPRRLCDRRRQHVAATVAVYDARMDGSAG
jgi:hypothetical protein